ncbi:MAG: Lrp/AsnC family transcriptional regulator [Candidatus Aenigmarchaeota archaeon]|nr:Lrp/AsnC family transcriptional regulator [Candidatus Aenigmarchaeota archaeon]
MDSTDEKILKELSKDARTSYRALAQKLGLAIGTIASRVRRLESAGVIKSYTCVIDYEKIGYDIVALIEFTVSKGRLEEVEKKIAEKKNVYGVYDVTGLTDSVILARFRDRRELNAFVKDLLRMENIERTNTHVILNVVKEDYRAF